VSGVLKYTFTCSDEHDLRSVRESQLSRHGNKVAYQVLDLKKAMNHKVFKIGRLMLLSCQTRHRQC
jgi:hypothetical protein